MNRIKIEELLDESIDLYFLLNQIEQKTVNKAEWKKIHAMIESCMDEVEAIQGRLENTTPC